MTERRLMITEFVRGMAWHDIGKPFALGTRRHTALGYWLLDLLGYEGEALVAWAHGRGPGDLKGDAETGGVAESPPGILALCNPIDKLAASIYSLQSRGLKTSMHSSQNPFTRLPITMPESEEPFVVPHEDLSRAFEPRLWEQMREGLPQQWKEVLTKEAKAAVERGNAPPPPPPLSDSSAALRTIRRAMTVYPERTYPSVNDTSLDQHGRLGGILAFVVYRNLERSESGDRLDAMMSFGNGGVEREVTDAPKAVRRHVSSSLVRIALTGHRELFEDAVRVDDLYGALELAHETQTAFKQALAEALDAPELAEFLPISEDDFDLVYLLPPTDGPLEVLINRAYETAIGRVMQVVSDRLKHDFPGLDASRGRLRQQLEQIGYGLRVIPINVPDEVYFNEFAAGFGNNLLSAYVQSQEYALFPQISWADEGNWADRVEPLRAAQVCEVCGDHAILTPPESLDPETKDMWLRRRDYAAHIFRGEREEICLSCAARRTLAHGRIAKQMDAIVQPMLESVDLERGMWRTVQPCEGPRLPPSLGSAVQLTTDDELVDLGAVYVRHRQTSSGVDRSNVDVFPTVSYAADATGNVILLALQPTETLFARYAYDDALEHVHQLHDDSMGDAALWQEGFAQFHNEQREKAKEEQEEGKHEVIDWTERIRHVYPHLARVMGRIQRIRWFYEDLYEALAEQPPEDFERLCVLPLDIGFPTLRLLLPADQLDQALGVLDRVVTESLLSATYFGDLGRRQQAHRLLELIVPDLLHGAVVLFKQKFPLYLVLEAERDVFHQLCASDPHEPAENRRRPGNSEWYGFQLGFSDLRGSLSEVGPLHAQVTYETLGQVLELVDKIDRRTVLQYKQTAEYISPDLAEAQAMIRTRRVRGLDVEHIRALSEEERGEEGDKGRERNLFAALHFIKRARRR